MTISRSQMTKQMENNVDKFKPMTEADYEKLTPAQKKAYKAKVKEAMRDNLPNAADKARQDALDKEFGTYNRMPAGKSGKSGMAKSKAGGMAKSKAGGMAKKPKGYSTGKTVRGAGKAMKGVRACKMR